MLGGSAASVMLGGCAQESQPATNFGVASADHSGARLSAILRKSFNDESNDLIAAQSAAWARDANASLDALLLDDWREVYRETAERREGHDLADLFGASAHLYANRLADVSEVAAELGAAHGGWMEAGRAAAVVDGVWRAIPWVYTAHAINFREDLLDEVGASTPTTWTELLEAATRLRDANLAPAGLSMNVNAPNDSANLAYSLLWCFGGQEVDETGMHVALDSQATRDALAFFKELAAVSTDEIFTFDEGGNNAAFLESRIAMTQNASTIYWKALQDNPEIAESMNHVRYPAGPAGNHQLVELNSIAIFDHSRNVSAAKDWIRHMMDPAQLRPRAAASLSFFAPTLLDYENDPELPWNFDPKLGGMRGIHQSGHLAGWPGPASIEATLVQSNASLVRMFSAVGQGNMTIGEAIATATEELRRVYET